MYRVLAALVLAAASSPASDAQTQPAPPQDPQPETAVTRDEIERLRRDLESETRSTLELLGEGHTETGGLNDKLRFGRVGARLNLERGAATTLRVTALHTPYASDDGVLEESATSLALGARSRRSERVEYEWEVGAIRFSTGRWDGTGLLRLKVRASDAFGYSLGASRSLVEESVLSAVGLDPALGPFAGERVGAVTNDRLTANGTWQLPRRLDLVGEAAVGVYSGRNAGSNLFARLGGGPAWNAVARARESSVSLLRVGAWFEYFGFDEDRLGYGGASLIDAEGRRVPPAELGSDGIPPDPSPREPGVGGYFSPGRFTSLVARVEVRGRASSGVDYGLTAFLGRQSYTDAEASRAGGVAASLTLRLGQRGALPVSYVWDNYGPFKQQSLEARVVFFF